MSMSIDIQHLNHRLNKVLGNWTIINIKNLTNHMKLKLHLKSHYTLQ